MGQGHYYLMDLIDNDLGMPDYGAYMRARDHFLYADGADVDKGGY